MTQSSLVTWVNHQALTFSTSADALTVAFGPSSCGGYLRCVNKGGTVQPDVDKGGLHAGQYPHHLALVNVGPQCRGAGYARHAPLAEHRSLRPRAIPSADVDQISSLMAGSRSGVIALVLSCKARYSALDKVCHQGMAELPSSSSAVSHTGKPLANAGITAIKARHKDRGQPLNGVATGFCSPLAQYWAASWR